MTWPTPARALGCCLLAIFGALPVAGWAATLEPGFELRVLAPASGPLDNAIGILQRDLSKTLGTAARVVTGADTAPPPGSLVIVQHGGRVGHLVIEPLNGFESHRIFVRDGCIIAQGADLRGTLYAVMAVSEHLLKIPPLWFWASYVPAPMPRVEVPDAYRYDSGEPFVRYRAWFPNDTDLLGAWRYGDPAFNELWLETMLRLKLNCMDLMGDNKDNMAGDARDYTQPFPLPENTRLLLQFGLRPSFTHINPLNGPFSLWDAYWRDARHQEPPALLLSNQAQMEEFWRYNVRTLVHHGLDPLWTINLRGRQDEPFWRTFTDAPADMAGRGEVITRIVARQLEILREETGNPEPDVRMVFYNEVSDLLGQGLIKPPTGPHVIWNFVAARRDHYPNEDLRTLKLPADVALGYYMNLQFTSTGSHLAPAEGPWKMEANFRYVNSRRPPLRFSVVNAGNIREHVLTLAANARLLWDFGTYRSDDFLAEYCRTYFGAEHAAEVAGLYREYFYSYWQPRRPEPDGIERQFLFHDLRFRVAVGQLTQRFFEPYDPNPLQDYSIEHVPNRTFRIVPADNDAVDQVGAILHGTTASIAQLESLTTRIDALYARLEPARRPFFNDNLRVYAHVMLNLNRMLRHYVIAYQSTDPVERKAEVESAVQAAQAVARMRNEAAHGPFAAWYANDRVFNLAQMIESLESVRAKL